MCVPYDVANGSTLSLTMWWRPGGGDQVGSGVLCAGLASQQWGFIMHTHHIMHDVMLAPKLGLLTQVLAIICNLSTLLEVFLPDLNSMLVNRLLSVPWLGE